MKYLAPLTLIAALLATTASADTEEIGRKLQETAKASPEAAQHLQQFRKQLSKNPAQNASSLLSQFLNVAPEGRLTREAVNRQKRAQVALSRGTMLGQFLAFDLDGDGAITTEERDATLAAANGNNRSQQIMLAFLEGDADGNDTLSPEELRKYASKRAEGSTSQRARARSGENYLVFDLDGDGTIEAKEVRDGLAALGETEIAGMPQRRTPTTDGRTAKATCSAPAVDDSEVMFLVATSGGAALSTVTLAGQDEDTTVAHLTIKPGDVPIYLFLASGNPMIWKIDGATDRISKLVAQRPNQTVRDGVGIVGIPEAKITFTEAEACLSKIPGGREGDQKLAKAELASKIGRGPDLIASRSTIGQLPVPPSDAELRQRNKRSSGITLRFDDGEFSFGPDGIRQLKDFRFAKPNSGYPRGIGRVTADLLRFYEDGLSATALEDIVGSNTPEPYEVYPSHAGLIQLMLAGKIERTDDGYFLIKEPFSRFPSGLHGAHHARFILGKGVEMPAGSPGHSTVYSEETGECLVGRGRCN